MDEILGLFRFEDQHAEGREEETEGVRKAMSRDGFGRRSSGDSDIGSSVQGGVRVEYFPVESFKGYPDPVVFPRHRREIENKHKAGIRRLGFAYEGDHCGTGIPEIDPLKSRLVVILLIERRFMLIEMVELPYISLQAGM